MVRVCIVYSRDHQRHMIIRRKLETFLHAGIEVVIVDQADRSTSTAGPSYGHTRVRNMEWKWFIRVIWLVVRRVPGRYVRDRFWRFAFWLRMGSNALRMAVAAAAERTDLYIAEDLQSAVAALIAGRLRSRPIVYDAHEIESEQGHGDEVRLQRAVLQMIEANVVPQVDRLVVPSAERGAFYSEQYGVRSAPTVVLNCPPVTAAPAECKLREELNVPAHTRLVLYHGALIPHRALDNLVRSALRFDKDILLVLIGEQGKYYQEVLAPLVQAEELGGRVFFLPFIHPEDLPAYVASADLGVVIYERVNLNNYLCAPTKLYEFIMMGIPVAVCSFPTLTGFLEEYPLGVAFDPSQPQSIADAVNRFFAESADDLVAMRHALAMARKRFTWERESAKWLELLGLSGRECRGPQSTPLLAEGDEIRQ